MERKTERLLLIACVVEPKKVYRFDIMLEDEKIGNISICMDYEIIYEIDPKYWGKGYATEALKSVMKIAFENGKQPLLTIDKKNIASRRVAEKAGFHVHYEYSDWLEWIATKKPE